MQRALKGDGPRFFGHILRRPLRGHLRMTVLDWLRNFFRRKVLMSAHREMGLRKYFAQRPLRQRVIALAAAYAIALSSLIASFGAAQAAAEAAFNPGGIICHNNLAGQQTPSPAGDNGKTCLDCCCGVGCTMTMAALPPLAGAAPLLRTPSRRLAPPALAEMTGARADHSHRSRAPPLNA